MAGLVVLYFINLPSLQLLVLNTYEELLTRSSIDAINALYAAFYAFVMNCGNQELIWLNFRQFPRFNNSKETELLMENKYGPSYFAEFVFGLWLGKGCRPQIYIIIRGRFRFLRCLRTLVFEASRKLFRNCSSPDVRKRFCLRKKFQNLVVRISA